MTTKTERWQTAILAYAKDVNAYVAKGEADGWENAGNDPEMAHIAGLEGFVRKELRLANAAGEAGDLSERLAPSHLGLVPLLEDAGQSLIGLAFRSDGTLMLRTGSPWQTGKVYEIGPNGPVVLEGVDYVGQCPNRRYYAIARSDGVCIHDGWNGPQTVRIEWPTGLEGLPDDVSPGDVQALGGPYIPTELIPFDAGRRVLLVASSGIWVLSESGVQRLFPSAEYIRDGIVYEKERTDSSDLYEPRLDMCFGAVSPDEKWIAAGYQDSSVDVFDASNADDIRLAAHIEPDSSYPHYAQFSADGKWLAANSCHFYNGHTLLVPERLYKVEGAVDTQIEGVGELDSGARVYGGTAHGDVIFVGDASGYVYAHSLDGKVLWRHFIGSSISSICISEDGQTLVVATYAGWAVWLSLDGEPMRPFEIGTGGARELHRYLFWKNEDQPLLWG